MTIFSSTICKAQINEIGGLLGGINFIGDVGATNYIAPNTLAFGGIYKWNRSKRHAYRASLLIGQLNADDAKSDDPKRKERKLEFSSAIIEAALGIEFNFFEFNLHDGGMQSTPYLYTGIAYSFMEGVNYDAGKNKLVKESKLNTFAIPISFGYKFTLSDFLILGTEIGARYTFSDAIDGSNPKEGDNVQRFGNLNNNDWYMFTGFTLTYTFGRNPCYCY